MTGAQWMVAQVVTYFTAPTYKLPKWPQDVVYFS